ncbi:MAG: hypothetical protein OQL16_13645 [Gammaproteobacteria bacterium]|nr:hypothetical protein [Gammaproteobacteria bacterium]
MDINNKPSAPVIWLSAIHVIYLMSLPVLTNFTLSPIIDDTWHTVLWFMFGVLGIPLGFAGMLSLNPFPRQAAAAIMRTFFLPVSAGLWWWFQEGTLLEYFAIMLIFEFLAIYLSIFFMCFIPLGYYDPENPKAGNRRTYINILIFQGFVAAGGFIVLLLASSWPWLISEPFWHHPLTYLILLIATIEYIVGNFSWHKTHSYRWKEKKDRPTLTMDDTLSIEPVLLLAPIPWFISLIYLAP